MDQNRCLLDVIDNPQLLQSFLESESSSAGTNNLAVDPATDTTTLNDTNVITETINTLIPTHLNVNKSNNNSLNNVTTTTFIKSSIDTPIDIKTFPTESSNPNTTNATTTDSNSIITEQTSYNTICRSNILNDISSTNLTIGDLYANRDEGPSLQDVEFDNPYGAGITSLPAVCEDAGASSIELHHQTNTGVSNSVTNQLHSDLPQLETSSISNQLIQDAYDPAHENDFGATHNNETECPNTTLEINHFNEVSESSDALNEFSIYDRSSNTVGEQGNLSSNNNISIEGQASLLDQNGSEIDKQDHSINGALIDEQSMSDTGAIDQSVLSSTKLENHTDNYGAVDDIKSQTNHPIESNSEAELEIKASNSNEEIQTPMNLPLVNESSENQPNESSNEPSNSENQQVNNPETSTSLTDQKATESTISAGPDKSIVSSTCIVSQVANESTPENAVPSIPAVKTPAPAPKRAPKKSTPRAPRGKNKNTNSSNQPQATLNSQATIQTQFNPPSSQQQIIFQTNNGVIRQPAILAPSPLGQPMGGMPQQQRVIQIQTANGPMYFAIAPGPAMNNSMMNQLPGMQSQQYPSQQICFQPNSSVMINRPPLNQSTHQQAQTKSSSDYVQSNSSTPTSQQSDMQQARCITSPQAIVSPIQQQQQPIRLQSPIIQYSTSASSNQIPTSASNQLISNDGLNKSPQMQNQQKFNSQPGPVILQNRSGPNFVQQGQTQQSQPQSQMISSQTNNIIVNGPQVIQSSPRMASPMMAGQTIAITSQPNNAQQQHIMLPSSQTMMVPRMSNQLILNRPMTSPGQLLPGQQQFIQIQTPNGPMLLALPTQPAQPMNNTMIDYNNQVQQPQPPVQPPTQSTDSPDSAQSSASKQVTNSKTVSNSKSGLDLADLLLDCGILPEDRMAASQSPSSIKTSQSPSVSQISSPMPTMPMINSPMSSMDSSSLSTNSPQTPLSNYGGQPIQQQPIRITIGPDGQMIMQPTVYGSIRPVLASTMGQTHLNAVNPTAVVSSGSPMLSMSSGISTPNNEANSDSKKISAKGKGTATKRGRSKKSDLDKFPILKTPKIAQKQQQQQQLQQHMQAVTVVPMTVLVGDQNKVLGGQDVKSNIAQLGGQQVSLAKIVTPVIQTAALQPLVNSNLIQGSISRHNMIATNIGQGSNLNLAENTQLASESGNSLSTTNLTVQNATTVMGTALSTSTSQMSSSGNVTANFSHRVDNSGTVESNPHISSSLMPSISLSVDTLKIEQNGIKTDNRQSMKGIQSNNGLTTTLVIHQPPVHHPNSQNQLSQAQQTARQTELRAQSILNQLAADQNAALNPQTKNSFKSFEDACKRLLRYHVFDTQTVTEAQIKKVDEIFEAAAESLVIRKNAIYDKYRFLILKQSMKTVPSSEEVMLDQIFINDEHTHLKRERELFREYEAQLESLSLKQARVDSKFDGKDDCASDYFAFGENSPKRNNQDELDGGAHSRDVDDWLLTDKWGKSRYPSVPDSEAATAIESILNEELS